MHAGQLRICYFGHWLKTVQGPLHKVHITTPVVLICLFFIFKKFVLKSSHSALVSY
uniref:Uncharacterized protein n=1 Tax=Anguilla anguilla TaxID=7936 RepID=A0A0E9WSZ9_ANGAN